MNVKSTPGIYKQAQRFADITKALIINGNIKRAKRCMQVAETLFEKGNSEMKNVISNVFVFSVSSFIELHNCNIRDFFPERLKQEYANQIKTSGI